MEKGNRGVIIGIIIAVIIIVIILLFSIGIFKSQDKNRLTEDEFYILDASFDNYFIDWSWDVSEGRENLTKPIDWSLGCADCIKNSNSEWCNSKLWHITAQAKENLICHASIDGIDIGTNYTGLAGSFIYKGETKTHFFSERGGVVPSLDTRKNHDIIVCCWSQNGNKPGIVCRKMIIYAKC
jgi:hypothetical protein